MEHFSRYGFNDSDEENEQSANEAAKKITEKAGAKAAQLPAQTKNKENVKEIERGKENLSGGDRYFELQLKLLVHEGVNSLFNNSEILRFKVLWSEVFLFKVK